MTWRMLGVGLLVGACGGEASTGDALPEPATLQDVAAVGDDLADARDEIEALRAEVRALAAALAEAVPKVGDDAMPRRGEVLAEIDCTDPAIQAEWEDVSTEHHMTFRYATGIRPVPGGPALGVWTGHWDYPEHWSLEVWTQGREIDVRCGAKPGEAPAEIVVYEQTYLIVAL